MGRVRTHIDVDGRKLWTLFDPGAQNTYVVRDAAEGLVAKRLGHPWPARLGGEVHQVTDTCFLEAQVEGKPVVVKAYLIDRIGMDKKAKRPFEVLFGALAMQEWGIELDLKRERLDMSRYPHEFVEF